MRDDPPPYDPNGCGWDHTRRPDAPRDHDSCAGGPQPSRPDPGRPEHLRPVRDLPHPPADPFTELEEGYAFLHEQYTAAQAAGFSEERAFQLVMMLLNHALDGPPA